MQTLKKALRNDSVLVAVLFFVFTLFAIASASQQSKLFDFSLYWNAARHFFVGLDPYHPFTLPLPAQSGIEEAATPTSNFQVMSPPTTFLFFLPVAFVELSVARTTYLVSYCVLLSFSMFLLYLTFEKDDRRSWHQLFVPVLLAFPFGAAIHLIIWGGIAWICLFGLAFCLYLLKRQYLICAGAALVFTIVKPHLFWLIFLYLVAWSIRKREIKVLGGFAVTILLSVFICWCINPDSYRMYFASVASSSLPTSIVNATLPKILTAFKIGTPSFNWPLVSLVSGAIVVLTLVFTNRLNNPCTAIALLLPFSVALAPYAWGHDYIVCAPLLVYLALDTTLPLKQARLIVLFLYLALSVSFSLRYLYISGYAFIVPQFLLLAMVVLLSWRNFNPYRRSV